MPNNDYEKPWENGTQVDLNPGKMWKMCFSMPALTQNKHVPKALGNALKLLINEPRTEMGASTVNWNQKVLRYTNTIIFWSKA